MFIVGVGVFNLYSIETVTVANQPTTASSDSMVKGKVSPTYSLALPQASSQEIAMNSAYISASNPYTSGSVFVDVRDKNIDKDGISRSAKKLKTSDEIGAYNLYRRFYKDLTDGNAYDLNKFLSSDFVFRRKSLYKQPRNEWLVEVNSGIYRYFEDLEEDADVEIKGDQAIVISKNIVHTYIYGNDAIQRIKFKFILQRIDNQWFLKELHQDTYQY